MNILYWKSKSWKQVFGKWRDKQILMYSYNTILLNNKKQTSHTFNNMDEFHTHSAEKRSWNTWIHTAMTAFMWNPKSVWCILTISSSEVAGSGRWRKNNPKEAQWTFGENGTLWLLIEVAGIECAYLSKFIDSYLKCTNFITCILYLLKSIKNKALKFALYSLYLKTFYFKKSKNMHNFSCKCTF
jgi:hypothetical protein